MDLKQAINMHVGELEQYIYKDFESIVNINSFTSNIQGNEKVADTLINVAKRYDLRLKRVFSYEGKRSHLLYQGDLEEDYCALVGHYDTVHPPKNGFETLTYEKELIKGPGTCDMKAGIIIALYSVVVLKKIYSNHHIPIKMLFNSDEEIGSLDSKEIIQREFRNAKAGFVFEPGEIIGNKITTSRKGICSLDIKIIGKPAHSGMVPWDGENAIIAASDIMEKLNKLNDYKKGFLVGCNEIKGGIARNVVAPICEIGVDVRFSNEKDGTELAYKIEEILKNYKDLDVKIEYKLVPKRPPFVQSQKSKELFKMYKEASLSFGVECNGTSSGGVSDANFLSDMGVPTIDGLGAFGDFIHTKKEYIDKKSLIDKIKIFVLFFSQYIK